MRFRSFIAALLVASLAAPALPQALPDLGDASSAQLSESQEKTIGVRVMRDIHDDPSYVDDPEIQDYMNALGARLLLASDTQQQKEVEAFVLRDDQVNAFALPGGHIGVQSGLILLTENESELAGVVGHELGHILQHHQARMMHDQRGMQFTSLAALALALIASRAGNQGGQLSQAAVASAGALAASSQLSYSRDYEREADRVGLNLLDRAGFAPRAMVTFFERMLRANNVGEFKSAPAYLQNHPLTTERIADMEDRVINLPSRLVGDTSEYRITRAKLRASLGQPSEAVAYFTSALEGRTVVRPREQVYGLALAQRRARDFTGAWKTLQGIRSGSSLPAYELLAGEIKADMGQVPEALSIYAAALRDHPDYRALLYANLDLLQQAGRTSEVLADVDKRLHAHPSDATLHAIQARAYGATGNQLAQHRSEAESQFYRGNLAGAVTQLEIAVRTKGGDFYALSSAEARLREMRTLLETQKAAEKALKIS